MVLVVFTHPWQRTVDCHDYFEGFGCVQNAILCVQTIILSIMTVYKIFFVIILLPCLQYNIPRVTHVTGIIGKVNYAFTFVYIEIFI